MIPGLWLEPEVAGVRSHVGRRTGHLVFDAARQRVIKNDSRYMLDFRNPAVTRLPGPGDRPAGDTITALVT